MYFNVWSHLNEELQILILSYFNADELITLCYVSKHFRRFVLSKFLQIYDISTCFCSVDYWTRVIKENVFNLIYKIYEKLWDTYPFDFEQYETLLIKKLRNMFLFSVSLHFLRCRTCFCTCFCSVDYWTRVIKENVFNLIYKIYEKLWDTYPFDFEQYETLLIKKLRNMFLFSVSLHFLRCRKSCENKPAYCRFCSRVRENDYYEYNAF